jgi:hypothetical protein
MNAFVIRKNKNLVTWQKEIRSRVEGAGMAARFTRKSTSCLIMRTDKTLCIHLKFSNQGNTPASLQPFHQHAWKVPCTSNSQKGYELLILPDLGHLDLTKELHIRQRYREFNNAVENLLLEAIVREKPRLAKTMKSSIFSLASSNTQVCTVSEMPWTINQTSGIYEAINVLLLRAGKRSSLAWRFQCLHGECILNDHNLNICIRLHSFQLVGCTH